MITYIKLCTIFEIKFIIITIGKYKKVKTSFKNPIFYFQNITLHVSTCASHLQV